MNELTDGKRQTLAPRRVVFDGDYVTVDVSGLTDLEKANIRAVLEGLGLVKTPTASEAGE